jgi:hypothetical protein
MMLTRIAWELIAMGRKATGKTTAPMRLPKDMSKDKVLQLYYDWLPRLLYAAETCGDSPRYYHLRILLDDLGLEQGQGGGGEKTHRHL